MALVELSSNGKRMELWFGYDDDIIPQVKAINGSRFVPKDKGGPYWSMPLDLMIGKELRRIFGSSLELGPSLLQWGIEQRQQQRVLGALAASSTAELKVLPKRLPKLYEAIHIGPKGRWMDADEKWDAMDGPASFQAADVLFGALSPNPINGNQMGLGKTLETIGSIYEAELDDGPILVVAPKSALNGTWRPELEEWQDNWVYVSTGTKRQKQQVINQFVEDGSNGWLVVNSDQVRYRQETDVCSFHQIDATKAEISVCPDCVTNYISEFPALHNTYWNAVVIDEAHKNAVRNPTTLTARGMFGLRGKKKFVLTGTPMGGKLIHLWGLLHFLRPDTFTSKWRWAEQWCGIANKEIYIKGGHGETKDTKDIGNHLRCCWRHLGQELQRPESCEECRDIERDFYTMMSPYMIRRTKAQELPWLPAKQHIDLWCEFGSPAHELQYIQMSKEARAIIEDQEVSVTSILAQYTRLKQFASFKHTINGDRIIPTLDSGKLDMLEGKLEELGIFDPDSSEQVVIGSQFSQVVDAIYNWLLSKGVPSAKITGAVTEKRRTAAKTDFQSADGGLRAMVVTTTAGGVSLTLDRASNMFILDETWMPDDQEQLEDRCHRASRIHQVTIYYLRTSNTIEESIQAVTKGKSINNMNVLDLRRILPT